jgi:sugar lactone lactonase YvrE
MRRIAALALTAATVLGAAAVAQAQPAAAPPAPPACTVQGVKLSFICGLRNPEDLVQVPGSNWIIGAGLSVAAQPGSGGLILIDGDKKTAARISLNPAAKPQAPFAACPGPLDGSKFSAHGLSILPQGKGKSRLFVVGHGGREAIEVFDVTMSKGAPAIEWIGCVPTVPNGQMNSVVALPDGRIISTMFYQAPMTMGDALQGKNTGAVYVWKPGGAFEKLVGTELPGANGVEVSPDRKYLLVAVTGTSSVMRYDLADTSKPPQAIKTDFRTDNLRWGPGGKLLLAGPGTDPGCKPGPGVRCVSTPVVGALDPATMKLTEVYRGPGEPGFQGLSSALIVGKTLWLGSYMSDRAAYTGL